MTDCGPRTRTTVAILAATAAVQAAGCGAYHQAAIDDLSVRERVRLEVEDRELPALIAFAEGPMGRMRGRFLGAAGDSATFELENAGSYRTVTLPRGSVVFLERREPNLTRSLLLSGVVVGGIGALAYLGFEGEESGDDSLPPDTEALTPLFVFTAWPR